MTVDKSLLAGSTTMLVLKLLDGQDMYGYQMIEELARRSERAFALKTGTLYPLLHSLEEKELVALPAHALPHPPHLVVNGDKPLLSKFGGGGAPAPLLPFGVQGATFAARKRSRMGDIYHCGRPRAERRRLSWFCLRLSHTLPAPRLSSCDGKRRVRSLKTNF